MLNQAQSGQAWLEIQDLCVHYGKVQALHKVNMQVQKGEIVTLLGANGAGKTTTLATISGLLRPSRGSILFQGQRLDKLDSSDIVGLGISQSPEGRRVFGTLTVRENLDLGAYLRRDPKGISNTRDWIFHLFPRLAERTAQLAGTLSGGEQQMLAIARALMASPQLLLLDEPSLGLAPMLVRTILESVVTINREGVTVVLVEQNANAALRIAHRGYVMEVGRILLQDQAQALLNNPDIRRAYLGG